MGAPTSVILAEIFIQHLEHTTVFNILMKHHIIDYFRYADNTLIVYNRHNINIENTLVVSNSIYPQIKSIIEKTE
jgi:hypothetical protein